MECKPATRALIIPHADTHRGLLVRPARRRAQLLQRHALLQHLADRQVEEPQAGARRGQAGCQHARAERRRGGPRRAHPRDHGRDNRDQQARQLQPHADDARRLQAWPAYAVGLGYMAYGRRSKQEGLW